MGCVNTFMPGDPLIQALLCWVILDSLSLERIIPSSMAPHLHSHLAANNLKYWEIFIGIIPFLCFSVWPEKLQL